MVDVDRTPADLGVDGNHSLECGWISDSVMSKYQLSERRSVYLCSPKIDLETSQTMASFSL